MEKHASRSIYFLMMKFKFRISFGKALLFAAVYNKLELRPIAILVKSK